MPENLYVLLGVDSDATQDQIKSAYRRKVRELHPDHFEGGSEPFLAVREAYEVLSDPGRQRRYDRELSLRRTSQYTTRRVNPEPLRPRRSAVEPLVPTRLSVDPWESDSGACSHSPLEGSVRRSWIDLDAAIRPSTASAADVHVEVTLAPEQALRGGGIGVCIPMQLGCPACRGQGGVWFFECPRCFGRGVVSEEYPVQVAFPAGVTDGATASVRLRRPGICDVRLTVHLRVHQQR
jgi:hypothetical protein